VAVMTNGRRVCQTGKIHILYYKINYLTLFRRGESVGYVYTVRRRLGAIKKKKKKKKGGEKKIKKR